ncbi:MAG: glutamate racemase [Acinetobacter sp.]|nr:glutamate racemase [Acinetobacter sp.]
MSAIFPLMPINEPMPHAKQNAPIGIFDSGIGGLSVALEIARYLPQERILYYADTANVPYGPRDDQNIRELTAHAVEWLYRQGCKVAVVACNTASAFSLDHLREHYGEKFPIIGLVPALKPAVLQTQSKSVAVLATPATFRGKLIKDVIKNFAEPLGVNVSTVTCLDLVPLVESGQQNSQESHQLLQQLLDPIVDHGVDFLVLGCTHYPFLKDAIQHVYGDKLSLVDSGFAVARQTSRILIKNDLVSNQFEIDQPRLACFVSGQNAKELKPIIKCLIDSEISWTVENIVEKFN